MADADDSARTARPKGGPNAEQLRKAQKKHKVYDKDANTEYERLLALDKKTKLNANNNGHEHAFFYHLCELREGWLH